ncbi:hypothetical protein ACN469_21275 [Corallococcus terminator]
MRHAAAVAFALLVSLPALAARREGTCEVRVSGGVPLTFTGKGGTQSATSDHWLSPEEMRQLLAKVASKSKKASNKTQVALEKQAARGGGMMGPLSLHCISASDGALGSLSILPGTNTQESIPFKPGTYPLVTFEEKRGQLPVALRLKGINYMLTEPGVLVLTRFDGTGVAGTFTFNARTHDAENKPGAAVRNIRVVGSFDIPCGMKTRVCR